MNWFDGLQAFVSIAKYRSFVGAAKELNIATPVITKRLQWLEEQLTCTLFLRTTRKVALTDAGEQLLKKVMPLLDEWQDVQLQLQDYKSQPQGGITVCLPPNVSGLYSFNEIFNQFLQKHPQLQLHIVNTAKPIDLLEDKIDVLIATDKYLLDPSTVVGLNLIPFTYQCFAAPSYIKKHGAPQTPNDLKQHNCLIYRDEQQWLFANKQIPVNGNLRADSGDSLITGCVLGTGIAYLPCFMVQKELQTGLITQLLPKHLTKEDTLKIYYPKHEYKPRKIALLVEFLRNSYLSAAGKV